MKNISNIIGMTATSLVAVAGTSAVIRGFNQFPKLKKKVKKKSRK
jgi:hypothetical protein